MGSADVPLAAAQARLPITIAESTVPDPPIWATLATPRLSEPSRRCPPTAHRDLPQLSDLVPFCQLTAPIPADHGQHSSRVWRSDHA